MKKLLLTLGLLIVGTTAMATTNTVPETRYACGDSVYYGFEGRKACYDWAKANLMKQVKLDKVAGGLGEANKIALLLNEETQLSDQEVYYLRTLVAVVKVLNLLNEDYGGGYTQSWSGMKLESEEYEQYLQTYYVPMGSIPSRNQHIVGNTLLKVGAAIAQTEKFQDYMLVDLYINEMFAFIKYAPYKVLDEQLVKQGRQLVSKHSDPRHSVYTLEVFDNIWSTLK